MCFGEQGSGHNAGRMLWATCPVSGPFSSTSRLREVGGGMSQGGACGAGGHERAATLHGGDPHPGAVPEIPLQLAPAPAPPQREGGQLRKHHGGMQLRSRGGAPGLWRWMPQAWREAVGRGRCARSGGSSELGRAPPPSGPGLALVSSLAHWHEGAKGICPGVRKLHAPKPSPWGFPTWQETFPGQAALGGSCRVPLAAQGTCLSFPFFGAGLYFLCPLQPGCQVGAMGCAGVQGPAQGARWEARPVGRVLGMLSAVCEHSAPSQKGGSSHWGLARSICRAGGVCHAVEQGGYRRESSMPGNPREKGGGLGCASSTGT